MVMCLCGIGAASAGCNKAASGSGRQVEGKPVETKPPNAPGQAPAFPGQTRAPFQRSGVAFDVQVVAKGLEHPWSVAFLPDRAMLVTGRGSLFVGGLAGKHVARLAIEDRRVAGEERLLADRARFRDVRVGPDGALYLLTDEADGELLRLVPATSSGPGAGPG
jgi:glucose/arabinose dehydrogenase